MKKNIIFPQTHKNLSISRLRRNYDTYMCYAGEGKSMKRKKTGKVKSKKRGKQDNLHRMDWNKKTETETETGKCRPNS